MEDRETAESRAPDQSSTPIVSSNVAGRRDRRAELLRRRASHGEEEGQAREHDRRTCTLPQVATFDRHRGTPRFAVQGRESRRHAPLGGARRPPS